MGIRETVLLDEHRVVLKRQRQRQKASAAEKNWERDICRMIPERGKEVNAEYAWGRIIPQERDIRGKGSGKKSKRYETEALGTYESKRES